MRPLVEVQAEILDAVEQLPVVRRGLSEALGLVLTKPIVADHDLPPFSNSAVDGFAVKVADLTAPPARLRILGEVPAGTVSVERVVAGTAIKVMTGAPLPEGTEAVVRVEDTETIGDEVVISVAASAGDAVRPAGGDVTRGTVVLEAGKRLTPADLGVMASLGVAWPDVRRRPTVAILSTGDEIVPPETKVLGAGKIRDANRFLLRGLLEESGATVVDYGIVPDDATALNRTLGHAANNADVIVSSGGVSMGDYDVVKEELLKLGTVDFWQVAMQPAKPLGFGFLGDKPFFGLPGNPVSVVVAFEQFVRPTLLNMIGAERLYRPRVSATVAHAVRTDPRKAVFLRMVAEETSQGWVGTSSGGQSSNVLSALAIANAFGVVPVDVAELSEGDAIELELFRLPSTRTRKEALGV